MGKCEICGKEGSRMAAEHKDFGNIMVCQECWVKLYDTNRMMCSISSSGGSCPTCR